MRAYEFINEAKKAGKLSKNKKDAMGPVHKSRDVGGYDRTNHAYRMGMAMAMADGKSKKAVDMDSASWIEKYNTMHPYTKEEHNMIHSAMNTIPTDHKTVSDDQKSKESNDTHRVSPVSNWNKKSSKKKTTESVSAGVTSTASIGANTAVAPQAKQKKKKNGTAVNALDGDSIFARPAKR